MKRPIALALTALLAIGAVNAKTIKEITLTTDPPMHCASCENKIKKALKYEKGVKDIVTDLDSQSVTIRYDADKTDGAKLAEALRKGGYESRPVEECEPPAEENCDLKCDKTGSGCHQGETR